MHLFFGIEMSFLWYRGGLRLLFGIEIFLGGIEILRSVVQHIDHLLPGINLCMVFWASTSCKLEVNKDLDTEKKIKKSQLGRTPKGSYSLRGGSRLILETPFSEPLLRTLLRTPFYCKTHSRPPSENPSPEPFPEPSQNPS